MIRNMVGLLLDVGRGKVDPADVPRPVRRIGASCPYQRLLTGWRSTSTTARAGRRYDHPLHSDLDSLE